MKYIFTQSELNLSQQRWLELIKNYDLEVHYHPGMANVVADALRQRSYVNAALVTQLPKELCAEFEHLNFGIVANAMELEVEPTLEQEIHKGQLEDEKIKEISLINWQSTGFLIG